MKGYGLLERLMREQCDVGRVGTVVPKRKLLEPGEALRRPWAAVVGQRALVAVALSALLVLSTYACAGGSEPDAGPMSSEASVGPSTADRTEAVVSSAVPTPLQATPANVVQTPETEKQASSSSTSAAHVPETAARTGDEKPAPDLVGIDGWINSEPFTLASQRGKVVLVDFWTYTCVNCIRTFPYLRDWNDKYNSAGLVILGVHTPEFEFEKLGENVARAVDTFEIKYPVAQDNDRRVWNAFRNKVWPGKYLIDKDGYIRYTHLGEGAYEETERKIRELLAETGADLANIPADTAPEPQVDPDALTATPVKGLTRELYAGYDRNLAAMSSGNNPPYILHIEYYTYPDSDLMYTDVGERENHYIALQGLWRNEPESLVHGRTTENYEDYIVILFAATSVNAVMEQWIGKPYTVRVLMDGAPLRPEDAGSDVVFDDEGNSYVLVTEPRMYRLVNLDRFGEHELKLSSNSYEFSLFAFTFGAYTRD